MQMTWYVCWITRRYIHHSLEMTFIIKTCTYCMRRGKWKSIITDSRLWTRAILSKITNPRIKRRQDFCHLTNILLMRMMISWRKKGRINYFVISFLFLYTNCWLLITKIKFRCRLMTRQIIDQYSTWRYISKVHACQIRISSVSRNVMLPVIMMSLPNANASSIARNVYQMHSAD